MSKRKKGWRPPKRATRISTLRAPQNALVSFLAFAFLFQALPTQIFAAMLGYPEWLGRSLVPQFPVYVPGEYAFWVAIAKGEQGGVGTPLPLFHLHLPYVPQTEELARAIALLPVTIGAAIALAVVCAVLIYRWLKGEEGDVGEIMDSGTGWGDSDAAEEQGLTEPAGIPLGFLEDGTFCRYSGDLGYSYVDPPGRGKTSSVQTMLTIPLQHARARITWASMALRDRVRALWDKRLRPWSAKQRRMHPYGEEPMLVPMDPKFEYVFKSSGYQHDVLHKRTELVAPFGVPDVFVDYDGTEKPFGITEEQLACYNPLWSGRLGQDRGFQDFYGKTLAIVDTAGEGLKTHWDRGSLGWGAALSEHLGFVAINTGNYEMLSYAGMVDYLSAYKEIEEETTDPKTGKPMKVKVTAMDVLLREMMSYAHDRTQGMRFGWKRLRSDGTMEATRVKPSIFNAANRMLAKDVRERSAVFSTWIEMLNLFSSDALRRFSMRSTFEFKAMANDKRGSATVYIGANPMDLAELQPYLRMIYEDFFRELTYGGTPSIDGRSVRPNIYPAIAVQDEAYLVGYNYAVDKGSGFIRGFGVYLMQIWQSVAQYMKTYTVGGKFDIISETIAVHLWGASQMKEAADYVVGELGEKAQKLVSEQVSGDRWSLAGLQQISERVDTPEIAILTSNEFRKMPDTHYVGVVNGTSYAFKKPRFFEDDALLKRSQMKPKLSSENTVAEPFFVRSVRKVIGDEGMREIVEARGQAFGAQATENAAPSSVTLTSPVKVIGGLGAYTRVRARSVGEAFAAVRAAEADEPAEPAEEREGVGIA